MVVLPPSPSRRTTPPPETMDWTGQKHAEWVYQVILVLFSLVGFVYAYLMQDFTYCFYGWLAGLVLASALTIPDMPWFNKHPIKWLDEVPREWTTREYDEDGNAVVTDESKSADGSGGSEAVGKKKHKKKKKGKTQ